MRPWIKRHTADLDDLRFSYLASDPEAEQVYARLYQLAGIIDADGLFVTINGRKWSIEEIAYRIRLPLPRVTKAIKRLEKYKLLHINGRGPQIADWNDQQVDLTKIREQTKERVTRYRQLHGNETREQSLQDGVTTPEPEPESDQNQSPESDKKPTTLPSSKRTKSAGGKAGSKSASPHAAVTLNKTQSARKATIIKILGSSGIRNPKLETISTNLATRSFKSDELIAYLMGGLASAYSDDKANNKNAVAAYRLENDQVPADYIEDPRQWKHIPAKVLHAAGIDHLDGYITKRSMAKYMGDSDE